MSEDWKAGDIAACVDDRPGEPPIPCRVKRGRLYRVSGVLRRSDPHSLFGEDGGGLALAGVHPECGRKYFAAKRFRKLNDEPDDIELIERIKASKPVSVDA